LSANFGIRARVGHHIHVAGDVRHIYMAGSLELSNQCLLQSPWRGQNRRVIWSIVNFVSQ